MNVSLPKEGTKEEVSMAMEETPVAIGMIIDFAGGTQEQYEAVLEQLNLGGKMPPGGIFHAAGPIRSCSQSSVVSVDPVTRIPL